MGTKYMTLRGRLPERENALRPDQISRMNGREMAGLFSLGGAVSLLAENVPAGLEKRLRTLGIWWRIRGLTAQLRGIQNLIEESAEDEQRITVRRRCQHLTVYIGMDGIKDPDATYIRIEDLNVIISAVLEDTCGLCEANREEARKCPLRQALRACTTIDKDGFKIGKNGCEFRGMNILDETEGLPDD